MSLRSVYREDGDPIGVLAKWWMRSNYSDNPEWRGTLHVAMCSCKWAQEDRDIMYTKAKEIHCEYCGRLLQATSLLGITKDSVWIDKDSGRRFIVTTLSTTGSEEDQSQPAPSPVPRW